MYHIKIFSVGKTKEPWLKLALEEYTQRLTPVARFEFLLSKTDTQLNQSVSCQTAPLICLDPKGKNLDSEQFSELIFKKLTAGGAHLSFVIGGATGISDELKKRGELVSLSPLTFTHQMTRLILLEQIFRAFEIQKGSNYHK